MTHNPHLSLIQNQYLQKTLRFYPDSLISTTSPQSIASALPPSAPYPSSIPPTPAIPSCSSIISIASASSIPPIASASYPPIVSASSIRLSHLHPIRLLYLPHLSASTSIISIHIYLPKFIYLIINHLQNNHKNNYSKIWSVQKKVVTLHRISEKTP